MPMLIDRRVADWAHYATVANISAEENVIDIYIPSQVQEQYVVIPFVRDPILN